METNRRDWRATRAVAVEQATVLEATVTAGCGTHEQKTWRLARPVTLIGSTRHAHIHIDGDYVEAVHAALLNTGDAVVLASLASRAGVYRGPHKIKTQSMRSGESFRLGTCDLRVDVEPRAKPNAQEPDLLSLGRTVRIRIIRGGSDEWTAGAVGTVIGSRPGCDVRLVSRDVLPLHALLTRVGGQVMLASLAADKAIRINDTHVSMGPLHSGDTLTIWPFVLRFEMADSAPA